MKLDCEQLMAWSGAYLDSELDTRTTLQVQQHLASCPHCAARFAAESRWHQGLAKVLGRTPQDPALWGGIERRVAGSEPEPPVAVMPDTAEEDPQSWRFWLWPSPRAHLGLAAVWAGLLLLHGLGQANVPQTVRPAATASSQVLVALRDQRRLADELLDRQATDPAPAGAPPQSGTPTLTRSDPV